MMIKKNAVRFLFLLTALGELATAEPVWEPDPDPEEDAETIGTADFGLSVPTASDDGNYTVTWSEGSFDLQEKFESGAYSNVSSSPPSSKSFAEKPDGTYWYRVHKRICLFLCVDLFSDAQFIVVSALSVPAPDALLGPDGDANGSYTVSWSAVTKATHYELERRYDGGGWGQIEVTNLTSRPETDLDEGIWDYRVRACDPDACSDWIDPVLSVAVAYPPQAPGQLTVPDELWPNHDSVSLSWTAASGEVSKYEVEEAKGSPSSWSAVATTTATSASLSRRNKGSYFYRVRACNTVGSFDSCGEWSNNQLLSVQQFESLGLVVPASNTSGSYAITWDDNGEQFSLLRVSVDDGAWQTLSSGGAHVHYQSAIVSGQYRYQLRQITIVEDGGGRRRGGRRVDRRRARSEFAWSYSQTTSVALPFTPRAPANLKTMPAALEIDAPTMVPVNSYYTLNWDASTGAATYQLDARLDESDFADNSLDVWINRYSGADLEFQAGPTKSPVTISYRVRACDAEPACGDWSASVSVQTVRRTSPVIMPSAQAQIQATWDAFMAACDAGDIDAAVQLMTPHRRASIAAMLEGIGDNIYTLSLAYTEIKEIETSYRLARYLVTFTGTRGTRGREITFERHQGQWVISAL